MTVDRVVHRSRESHDALSVFACAHCVVAVALAVSGVILDGQISQLGSQLICSFGQLRRALLIRRAQNTRCAERARADHVAMAMTCPCLVLSALLLVLIEALEKECRVAANDDLKHNDITAPRQCGVVASWRRGVVTGGPPP